MKINFLGALVGFIVIMLCGLIAKFTLGFLPYRIIFAAAMFSALVMALHQPIRMKSL